MNSAESLFEYVRNSTGHDHRAVLAIRWGQFTDLVVYDPQNRGSAFVESLLTAAGLRVDIQDEGEPVSNPSAIDSAGRQGSE